MFSIYKKLKFSSLIRHVKSKRFLQFVGERNPGRELHHAFGSVTGKKRGDHFIIPLTKKEHLTAHEDMAECFEEYADVVVGNIIEYVIELEQIVDYVEHKHPEIYERYKKTRS